MTLDRRGFVLANTAAETPPLLPELRLHLASEITPIWRMTEAALERTGLAPPFWAFAWAGGQALARYVLDHRQTVKGRRVLDFAAGGGLVAIAAMRAGATSALAADVDPFCETAVALNAAINGVAVAFTAADLLAAPAPAEIEVILAGDISYEKPTALRVRAWLADAAARGATVLMGDPGRTYFDRSGLVKLADYAVPTTRELEDVDIKPAAVWTFAGQAGREGAVAPDRLGPVDRSAAAT